MRLRAQEEIEEDRVCAEAEPKATEKTVIKVVSQER